MREIKFRGKRINGREWVYGDLHHGLRFGHVFIRGFEVDPATVGQYTGLKDRNGKEIYEGDIIKTTFFDFYNGKAFKANIGHTCYGDGCYFIMTDGHSSNILFRSLTADNLEVIGNIWENPELLEVAKA